MPNTPNGEIWREIERQGEVLDRHDRDIYRGNGKPGLTIRMEKVETSIGQVIYYAKWFMGILGAVLVAVIIDIATKR